MNAVVGDLNGDGLPDIVMGTNLAAPVFFLNNGTTSPFANVTGTSLSASDLQQQAYLADVNRDGHLDIVAVGFNSPTKIYFNNGTSAPFNGVVGTAIGGNDPSTGAAIGDVNGDGYPDIAVVNTNHIPSRLYLSNGGPLPSGALSENIGTAIGYGQAVAMVDVNGDGLPDLILAYLDLGVPGDPSGVAIYLNNGTANPFAGVSPLTLLVGHSAYAIAVADVNGDKKPDLVVATDATSVEVFLNTGSRTQPYTTATTVTPPTNMSGNCYGLAIADLNADGLPDIVLGCQPPMTNPPPANPAVGAIYLNNGSASPFANVSPTYIPASSTSGFTRSAAVATLIPGGPLDVLLAEGQPANYFPLFLDQNPIVQNQSVVTAINQFTDIKVLTGATASHGQSLNDASLTITTSPLHGTSRVNAADYSVIYQPDSGFSGNDSLQFTVNDNLGAISSPGTVNVRVQPAPVANNDSATTPSGTSVTINVLANDLSSGGTLVPSSLKIAGPASHGTATIVSGTGQITYQPDSGFSGQDQFEYTVADNLGTVSNSATVTVTVSATRGSGGGGALDALSALLLTILAVVKCGSDRKTGALTAECPPRPFPTPTGAHG
jgi:hypothetical protein